MFGREIQLKVSKTLTVGFISANQLACETPISRDPLNSVNLEMSVSDLICQVCFVGEIVQRASNVVIGVEDDVFV